MIPTLKREPRLVRKRDSLVMRALGLVMPIFVANMWTTIGHTIYVPDISATEEDFGSSAWKERHRTSLTHEWTHVAQVERWGLVTFFVLVVGPAPFLLVFAGALTLVDARMPWIVFTVVGVLAIPMSVGLAWGRWVIEREAYLTNVLAALPHDRAEEIDFIVDTLWRDYGFAWPRAWMREWFEKESKR